jgi:hypothetical protein
MSQTQESDDGDAQAGTTALRFDEGTLGAFSGTAPKFGIVNLLGGRKVHLEASDDED